MRGFVDSRPVYPPEYDQGEPEECPECKRDNADEESGEPLNNHYPYCCAGCERKGNGKDIAQVDFDYPGAYVGDEQDGVYVGTGKGPDGWYVSTIVDCDTGGFIDALITDDGPYPSEKEALQAGKDGASDWCMENEVDCNLSDPQA